jgi:predicted phage terminase large subunit-like protein
MTGKRGDRVIWDDPHSVEAAHSESNRETAIRVFSETLPSRLTNPDRSAIVIVMQRLHENDVSGHILKNDFGYEHLCLPMEFESSRRCRTSIGFVDPRKEDGDLLFPDRFPRWVVDRDKKVMGEYGVAGQMQQRPSPIGGGLFKGKYWKYYKVLPKIKYRMIFGDTAQKATQKNDYSVFQCWGRGFDNSIYLIDQLRGKFEAPELLNATKQFWNKHKAIKDQGVLRSLRIEDKVSGTGLIQTLQREGNIPVTGIPRGTDKISRAHDVLPQVESGYVYLPEDADWIHDYLAEFGSFPNGANDDQIDPTMDAINEMLINMGTDYSKLL